MTALLFNTDSAYSNEHYTSIKKADINWKRYLGRDYALLSSEEEDVTQEGIALSRIEIGGRSDSHKHPQAEGFYIISGACELVVEGSPCQLNAGDLCYIKPWVQHNMLNVHPDEPLEYICFWWRMKEV